MSSREISKVEEQMKDNSLFTTWTEQKGLNVRPAYAIDKLCFSVVDKGKGGKGDSFEIYMDTLADDHLCFDDIASDILSGRFEQILNYEKKSGEKYPKYYKYATGFSGEKHIGICNSSSGIGYCINAMVPRKYTAGFSGSDEEGKKQVIVNIPVSYHGLRKLSERYMASYKIRKDELEKIRLDAALEYSKNRTEKTVPKAEQSNEDVSSNSLDNQSESEERPSRKEYFINFKTDGEFFEAGTATKISGHVFISETDVDANVSELFFYEKDKQSANKERDNWYDRLTTAVKSGSVKVRVKIRDYGIRNGKRQYQFISVAPAA